MTRLYFAHPVSDFNTPFEARVVAALTDAGYEVVNPNSPEHQEGYKSGGFRYTAKVREVCDAVAYLSFPNGSLGSGVGLEVNSFRKRGLPVFRVNAMTLKMEEVEPSVRLAALDSQFTREETSLMKSLPNGGRP